MQNKTEDQTKRQLIINVQSWHWFLLGILFTVIMGGGISACYQGRDIARFTGRPVHIELPEDIRSYDDIVSISFHKNSIAEEAVNFAGLVLQTLIVQEVEWL